MSELCNRVLGEELGEGAHGKVFAVSENNVLKIVNDKTLTYKDALDFIVPRMFKHPNIVRSEGLCINKNQSSIILELASTDLYYQIKKIYRDESEVFRVIFDVLCGLYALHSNGFLHLDMKVENILVKPRNEGYMIADFGLSIYTSDINQARLDSPYFGTVDFFSPQAIYYASRNENQIVSFKEDIWGFFISLMHSMFYRFTKEQLIPAYATIDLINTSPSMDLINSYYQNKFTEVKQFAQRNSIRTLLFLVKWCEKIINGEDFTTLDIINELLTIQPHLGCNVSQVTWADNYLMSQEINDLTKAFENISFEDQLRDTTIEPTAGPSVIPSTYLDLEPSIVPLVGPSDSKPSINQIKPCGPRAPKGYSKDELVQMAVQHLGLTKYKANKLRVAELCKLLFGEQ